LTDATWIASVKGWSSGTVNLTLAYILGASLPSLPNIAGSMLVGFLAYGVSLTLFVVGLRHLGTARTSAYFSIAPFFGATLALLMGEPVTTPLIIAAILMAIGIWLHLTEQHQHSHTHEAMIHSHEHIHDEHHGPSHNHPIKPDAKQPHLHAHKPMTHTHVHFPDVHHRHDH
ncbi:MAG TPA: EamA family transporter, partial [Methylophaga sp.]|nr:EamA family transporter [Methylophaga sp.]